MLVAVIGTAVAIGTGVVGLSVMPGILSGAAPAKPEPTASASPTPSPTPLTPVEQLLTTNSDPLACAVDFRGPGITLPPMLQTQGRLFTGLPIPTRDGAVFGGWYATEADAAALTATARVNGAQLATCIDRRLILHAGWATPEQVAAAHTRVPILMYHQFTANPEGEKGWLRGNFAYTGDFEAQMAHIEQTHFYLPTWDELNAFIDGTLYLPPRSVIVTDDDADPTWLELAVPIVTQHRILTTSFVITKFRHEGPPSPYVLQRSHTDDMHEAGANGKGRMVNWTADQIAADLERSAQVLGAKEVVAYPYGHVNATAEEGVARAGFTFGRTTAGGFVKPGTDKLLLPVIRMNYGDTVQTLIERIG